MRDSDKFLVVCTFSTLALYLFYDSGGAGTVRSGIVAESLRQLLGSSGSSTRGLMLLLCIPFLLGFFALLHEDYAKWAWVLIWGGGVLLVVEFVSRWHLFANLGPSNLLSLIAVAVVGAGAG